MTPVKKIITVMKSIALTCYYLPKVFFSKKNLKNGNVEIIVSLTSYGKRLPFAFFTIESIFNQSHIPSKIILWLYKADTPKGLFLYLLERQIKRGLVVKYVDEDVKSYKKLSYILDEKYSVLEHQVKYIVTADDDIFYPKHWLFGFIDALRLSENFVLCYRARDIVVSEHGNISPYNSWPLSDYESQKNYSILPTGVSGVCYPINSLDKSISYFDKINEVCPYADDIWYKMITTKNNFRSKLIVRDSVHFIPVFTGFTKGLEKMNVLNNRNDDQLLASMKFFGLTSESFLIDNREK